MIKRNLNIILVIASLIVGFYLNKLANDIANKKLLAQLEADIAAINQQQHKGRISPEESAALENRKLQLEAQIKILSQK